MPVKNKVCLNYVHEALAMRNLHLANLALAKWQKLNSYESTIPVGHSRFYWKPM